MDARLRQTTLWGTWVALVASCGGTSTGNPYDRGTGGEHSGNSGQCEEQRAMELELDAESELGFSARDVLDHAGEQREETLRWRALNGVSYGPESGTQTLTFGITPTGKARFVEYVPKSSGFEIASDCGEQLEIPVEVTLQSAQGALDERFTTVLTARSVELGRIYHRLKAERRLRVHRALREHPDEPLRRTGFAHAEPPEDLGRLRRAVGHRYAGVVGPRGL
jgi:hypothetical protein